MPTFTTEKKAVHLSITQEDIDQSAPSAMHCPIALAASRVLETGVVADYRGLTSNFGHAPMTHNLRKFMSSFDYKGRESVSPMEADVVFTRSVLK